MRIQLLGAFEVTRDGAPLALGGLKQRAVLAILALSPGRVVSVDRLVDDLWGTRPPGQAIASLQAYVSNLRRALEPDRAPREPPRILRSEGAGYVLAIDPDFVDGARFERLAAAGSAALRDGRTSLARDALAEALGLWCGPTLAEFANQPFAGAEAARLEELRADALESRVTADLALGAHGALVAELQQLVAAEPLREQLWRHLILALYRSGRQGDALAAYQACRRALDEALGVEPHPSLRQLEADVLRQAPELDWAPPEEAAPDRHAGAASLTYRDDSGGLQVFALTPGSGRITAGRDAAADLWLFWDPRVSRVHAEFSCDGADWWIADEGPSANGTYINGERVERGRVLRHDDELRFGDTVLIFRLHMRAAEAQTFLGD